MTVYFVTVGKNEYKVEIQQDKFMVNGKLMDLKLLPLNKNGLYLLELGKRRLELILKALSANRVSVMVENHQMVVQVDRNFGKSANHGTQNGKGDLHAPMPGIVLSTHVQEGQKVVRNELLITLESMKMQMEMRAQADCLIEKVCVVQGQNVEKGSLLVRTVKLV
jgi:biotin carboxyl carrier protein